MRLEDTIAAAAEKAAAAQQEWEQKHHPIRIGDKTYWLSTDVPKNIQDVLDVLPQEQEKKDVKRANQIKIRLSDEELEVFDLLVKTSGLPQGEYIRGMVLNGKENIRQAEAVKLGMRSFAGPLRLSPGVSTGTIERKMGKCQCFQHSPG